MKLLARFLTTLSALLAALLVVLALAAWFRPLRLHLYHSQHPFPFLRKDYVPQDSTWLNEPGEAPAGCGYLQPSYDCGVFLFTLYFRKNQYVTGEGFTEKDWKEFDHFERHWPLGITVRRVSHQGQTSWVLAVPVATLLVPLLLLPAVTFYRRMKRPFPKGCCRTCGYDLRAHRPGDKCPECGAPISPR